MSLRHLHPQKTYRQGMNAVFVGAVVCLIGGSVPLHRNSYKNGPRQVCYYNIQFDASTNLLDVDDLSDVRFLLQKLPRQWAGNLRNHRPPATMLATPSLLRRAV